jgi:ABC-type polysaccharide/polyol phosphate export permease
MFRVIGPFAWIEFKVYLRNRTALFWTFVNPLVTLVVLMTIFGGNPQGIRLDVDLQVAASDRAAGIAGNIVRDLNQSGFLEVRPAAPDAPRRSSLGARLQVDAAADGSPQVRLQHLFGEATHFRVLRTATELAVMNQQPRAATGVPAIAFESQIRREEGGLSYGEYLAVGILTLTVISVCLFGFSVPLVELRNSGAGRMYQVFPMSVSEFMAAYILSRLLVIVLLGMIIILFADLAYGLSFPVASASFLFNLFTLCLISAVAFISIGLMVAGITGSVAAANAVVNLLYLPLMFFSDIFLPLSLFPDELESILRLQPLAQFVHGARAVLIDGAPLLSQWTAIASLLAVAAAALAVARYTFHWRTE